MQKSINNVASGFSFSLFIFIIVKEHNRLAAAAANVAQAGKVDGQRDADLAIGKWPDKRFAARDCAAQA